MTLSLFLTLGSLLPAPPPVQTTPSTISDPVAAAATRDERDEDGVAARIGDQVITMAEYQAYLLDAFGRGPLDALIDRKLLRAEARRLGVELEPEDVRAAVEREWQGYLERVKGDEAAFVAELERGGFTADEYRVLLAERATDALLQQALCLRARVVTDEAIAARFLRRYGPNGDKVQVRHIFLNVSRERADRIAAGAPPAELSNARLEAELRTQCEELMQRLGEGEDFARLAAEEGHDIGARVNGGAIADYNYRAYGAEFSKAVQSAEVGVPVGPVRTQAGFHIIEVTSREHTSLDEVREALRAELAAEPAEFAEIEALQERLRDAVEIQTY